MGIIGLGSVGKELSKKAIALGLKVIGFDLFKDEAFLKENNEVEFTSDINVVYKNADIISLHIPHTPKSEKLINRDVVFEKCKKTPILINTSRGMLIDVDVIIEALAKKKLKGYLADVLAVEPITENEKLKGIENVIITPHVGSRTFQSVVRQGTMAVENLFVLLDK